MKNMFEITYKKIIDGEEMLAVIVKEFEDTENVTALEWAEDYAYSITDKEDCKIKAIYKE